MRAHWLKAVEHRDLLWEAAYRLDKTEESAISRIVPSQYLKVEHSSYHKTFVMNPVILTSAS